MEFNGVDTVMLNWNVIGNPNRGNGYANKAEAEIDAGDMATAGTPEVLSDQSAIACWDARRLPGVWTTALEQRLRSLYESVRS